MNLPAASYGVSKRNIFNLIPLTWPLPPGERNWVIPCSKLQGMYKFNIFSEINSLDAGSSPARHTLWLCDHGLKGRLPSEISGKHPCCTEK